MNKTNYQLELEKIIKNEKKRENGTKPSLLLHSCCAPCSSYVLEYLSDMSLYEEVTAGGKNYVLVHAGIADFDEDTELDDYMPEDFVSEPMDADKKYFSDATLVAGHTPTYEVAGAESGKIYHGEYGILVNCGVAFGEPLGCLRLEDGKEFYAR